MVAVPVNPRERVLAIVLWTVGVAVFGYYLFVELSTIGLTEPMSLWETVYVSICRAWPHGYQPGCFVEGHDNYGPGYPAYAQLFHFFLRDWYVAFRVGNLVAVLGSMAVLGWALRRALCPWAWTVASLAIYYAFLAGTYSIQGRPDFLLSLEIAGLLVLGWPTLSGTLSPVRKGILLGLLALAAYLTKPYALGIWGAVVSYDLLFCGWRRGAIVGVTSALLIAAGVAGFAALNPYYLLETFQAHLAHESMSLAWFVHQAVDFAWLLIGLVIAAAATLVAERRAIFRRGTISVGATDLRYWAWALAVGCAALAAGMGWHEGAYLTYHLHLVLPPLVIFAALGAARFQGRALVTGAVVAWAANVAVLLVMAPAPPVHDRGWDDLNADIAKQPGKIVVDFLLESVASHRPETLLASTGLSGFAMEEPTLIPGNDATVVQARAETRAYLFAQERKLFHPLPAAVYLDCVMTDTGHGYVMTPRTNVEYLPIVAYDFKAVAFFNIHPYYFATNEPRQKAGKWTTTIVKFVRTASPAVKP